MYASIPFVFTAFFLGLIAGAVLTAMLCRSSHKQDRPPERRRHHGRVTFPHHTQAGYTVAHDRRRHAVGA